MNNNNYKKIKNLESKIKKLNTRRDNPTKEIEILQRKIKTIRQSNRKSKRKKYIKSKNRRKSNIDDSNKQTKQVKSKKGFLNLFRIPFFRRKTRKNKQSLLSDLSQSVTRLSRKIPKTMTTIKIMPKMV